MRRPGGGRYGEQVTQNLRSALVVPRTGGRDVLTVEQLPVPEPGPLELLVEVAASGVNFIDVYFREGRYERPVPFVLGQECAGTVLAVGAGVEEFDVGDVVATAAGIGTHAGAAIVPADSAVPVPDGLDPRTAAAAMLQGMTAQYLVTSTHSVQPGETVLVHAAAGGVGQLLVQWATARGARVIATVGSAAKAEIARERGADAVIRYDGLDTAELIAAIRAAADGGVHVAYDGVGKATFDASLGSLHPRGLLVLYGASSGAVPPFDLQRLNAAGSVFVTRPMLVHYTASRAEMLSRASEVFEMVNSGRLEISIGGSYPLTDAARAYDDLENRRTTGKLLLIP
jgi:NADPH2:quinone reductase